MRRNLEEALRAWKTGAKRKPLVLKGARQVGKTWLLKHFAEAEYASSVYLNFEEDRRLSGFFEEGMNPRRLIRDLSVYTGRAIEPGKTLIIFDEIQESNEALNSLKYFAENLPEHHIASAGSLVGVKISSPRSFPVGKVDFLDLHPLSFSEFLGAMGEEPLQEMIRERSAFEPFPEPLHLRLVDLLRSYYFVGGMPEPVALFASGGDLDAVRKIQKAIVMGYGLDFSKHAVPADIPKLSLVWESLPGQLARKKKKFLYSNVKEGARAREYENALKWLEDAGLVLRSFSVSAGRTPLKAHEERSLFKVYAFDVGLLGALAEIEPKIMIDGDEIFRRFEGMLVENYVAQQFVAEKGLPLHYWTSPGTAEVDFVVEVSGCVVPLEAKAGINPKSKSLDSFEKKYSTPLLCRTSLLNMKRNGRKANIPLYAISLFPEICLSSD